MAPLAPNLRMTAQRYGRRVTGQVVREQIVDGEVKHVPVDKLRATATLVPMPPQRLLLKPEGERTWKWWQAYTATELELGWLVKPDRDEKRVYKVMSHADWELVGFHVYDFAEKPR